MAEGTDYECHGHGGRLRRMWGLHVSLEHEGGGWNPFGVLPSSLQ